MMNPFLLLVFFVLISTLNVQSQNDCRCSEVDDEAKIYKVAERMPLFPGCYEYASYRDKKSCADLKMLDFIYSNLRYPDLAFLNRTEGMAVVSFVVEPDGCISSIKTVRSPGDYCGKEAERLVKLMKAKGLKWEPGYHYGELVRVAFNLPIKFRISTDTETEDSRFMDFDPKCEVEPVDFRYYNNLDLKFSFSYDKSIGKAVTVYMNSNDSFEARFEVISAESGKVEYFLERPFQETSEIIDLDLAHLPEGNKYILVTTKGGQFELASFDFTLE